MDSPPPIRYATASDGVRIAYWSLGSGSRIVLVPFVICGDLEREWRVPALVKWYRRLSQNHRVIRFDARDSGLSQRRSGGFRLADVAVDVEAVGACRRGHCRPSVPGPHPTPDHPSGSHWERFAGSDWEQLFRIQQT